MSDEQKKKPFISLIKRRKTRNLRGTTLFYSRKGIHFPRYRL